MYQGYKYTLLLTSLPVQPAELFTSRLPVISRIQLDKHLAMLDANDTEDLARIEGLLHWSKMHEWDDATIVNSGTRELALIRSDFLRNIVAWRLELRTLLSALRRRHAGISISPDEPFLGFGSHVQTIRRNWQKPDFGLGNTLPWIKQAQKFLAEDKPLDLDKLMLNINWTHYHRLSVGHYFDFPAVVLYVLRWYLINRWVSYDQDRALLRFNELISAGMADVSIEFEGKS
jgi:hypothetical protein